MQPFQQPQGMGGGIEEVGIAEGDVTRAGADLVAHIFQDHILVDDAEAPVVHRHHRAMAAAVLASAAGLGVAHKVLLTGGHLELGVMAQRGQMLAARDAKPLASQVDGRFSLRPCGASRGQAARQREQALLELSPEDGLCALQAQVLVVQRRVQTVATQVRRRVRGAQPRQQVRCQPRRGVHGEMDGDEIRCGRTLLVQALHRQVLAGHRPAFLVQPGGRRGQPERLPTEVVGGQEECASGLGWRRRRGSLAHVPASWNSPASRLWKWCSAPSTRGA